MESFAVICGGRSRVDTVRGGMRLPQCVPVTEVWLLKHENVLSIQNKSKQKFKRKKCKKSKEKNYGEKMQTAGEESTVGISPQSSLFISSFWGRNISLERIYETSIIITIHQQRTVAKPSPHQALATKVQIPWQSLKVFFLFFLFFFGRPQYSQVRICCLWVHLQILLCNFLIDDTVQDSLRPRHASGSNCRPLLDRLT